MYRKCSIWRYHYKHWNCITALCIPVRRRPAYDRTHKVDGSEASMADLPEVCEQLLGVASVEELRHLRVLQAPRPDTRWHRQRLTTNIICWWCCRYDSGTMTPVRWVWNATANQQLSVGEMLSILVDCIPAFVWEDFDLDGSWFISDSSGPLFPDCYGKLILPVRHMRYCDSPTGWWMQHFSMAEKQQGGRAQRGRGRYWRCLFF